MRRVVVIGATSAIAHETSKLFASEKASMFLVGRNAPKLSDFAAELEERGASHLEIFPADLDRIETHQQLADKAIASLGKLDVVLIAHGVLPDQRGCEGNVGNMVSAFNTNCLSVLSLLTIFSNYFERQKSGTIAVITSKSGDRGRASTYVYGSAKGAVDIFLEGLRSRLFSSGVRVVTIKPGLVDTPMTEKIPKHLLFSSPQIVGKGVYRAIVEGRDVVYIPWFWRWIMLVIKMIPTSLYKRMHF